jgi:hypothetical protein
MAIHRSLGVSQVVALMAAHRGRTAHEQRLARLDRLLAEAGDLRRRAEELCPDDQDGGAIAVAFQTVLARSARNWMDRAEVVVRTVRPGSETVRGARTAELRQLINIANVAMIRPAESRECWREFYRSTREMWFTGAPSGS